MNVLTGNPLVTVVVGGLLLFFLIVWAVARRYKIASPNEALIITGRSGKNMIDPGSGKAMMDLSGQQVVIGGGKFVLPLVQKAWPLDLSSRQIDVTCAAISNGGLRLQLKAVAIVKVGGDEASVRAAAQRFLGQESGITTFTQEVLSGALRSIAGQLTVESIIADRATFQSKVSDEAENALTNQGLVIDSFQVQDVEVEGDYLKNLGRPIEAEKRREAEVAESLSRQEAETARIAAEELIAQRQRQLDLQKAQIRAEVDAANARAAAEGPLMMAARDREILSAKQQVAVEEALLRERQLDAEVKKPADAQRYAVEQEAAARANAVKIAAEGERARLEALAEAAKAEGFAAAEAIRAKGLAEADAKQAAADAYEKFGQAAVLDIVAKMLPEVIRAGAEPLSRVSEITVFSSDGSSRITSDVARTVAELTTYAEKMLGVDIKQLLSGLSGIGASGQPLPEPLPPLPPLPGGADAGPVSRDES